MVLLIIRIKSYTVSIVSVIYKCKACGFILYRFERVGQDYYGIPTPSEIMNWYGGVCPRCNVKLSKPKISDVKITPLTRVKREIKATVPS